MKLDDGGQSEAGRAATIEDMSNLLRELENKFSRNLEEMSKELEISRQEVKRMAKAIVALENELAEKSARLAEFEEESSEEEDPSKLEPHAYLARIRETERLKMAKHAKEKEKESASEKKPALEGLYSPFRSFGSPSSTKESTSTITPEKRWEEAQKTAREVVAARKAKKKESESARAEMMKEEKTAKPLELGPSVSTFTGIGETFRQWFILFESVLNPYGANDREKLLTLRKYLSADILIWISTLGEERTATYDMLAYTLTYHYKMNEATLGERMLQFLKSFQKVEEKSQGAVKTSEKEPVNTFYARLLALVAEIADLGGEVTEAMVKETFVAGLEPELQLMVRNSGSVTVPSIEAIVARAAECEANLKAVESSKSRRPASTPKSSNNTNSNSVQATRACADCGAAGVRSGQSYCKPCFDRRRSQKKSNNNSSSTTSSNNNSSSTTSSNNNSSTKPRNDDWKKLDFTQHRVPDPPTDDHATDPRLWSKNKLRSERKCFFCGQATDDKSLHPNGYQSCVEKYKHYWNSETRMLLHHGITPPARTRDPPHKG
jgi:hypothetical protein